MTVRKLSLLMSVIIYTIFLAKCPYVSAEVTKVEGKGTYTIDLNSKDGLNVATELARKEAYRKANAQAGIFIETHSESVNGILTKDKIIAYAASILEDVKENL